MKIYTVLITGTTQFGDIMVILHYTIKIAVCVNASIVTLLPSCNVSIYSAPADDNGCTWCVSTTPEKVAAKLFLFVLTCFHPVS